MRTWILPTILCVWRLINLGYATSKDLKTFSNASSGCLYPLMLGIVITPTSFPFSLIAWWQGTNDTHKKSPMFSRKALSTLSWSTMSSWQKDVQWLEIQPYSGYGRLMGHHLTSSLCSLVKDSFSFVGFSDLSHDTQLLSASPDMDLGLLYCLCNSLIKF